MGHQMSQTPGAVGTTARRAFEVNRWGRLHDRPDRSRPRRACAICEQAFQPTVRRRMLCAHCFVMADSNLGPAVRYPAKR